MKSYFVTTALASIAAFFLTAGAASAQEPGEFYVGIHGGASFLADSDNSDEDGFISEINFDTGFNFGGVVGYHLLPNIRVEGEVTYRENDLDGIRFADGTNFNAGGEASALSGLVNIWYDIPIPARVTPYVGGGVGVAAIEGDDITAEGVPLADDDDVVFGGQAGAGIRVPIIPRVTASIDYRYFRTVSPDFVDTVGNEFESEYETHNVGASVTFAF